LNHIPQKDLEALLGAYGSLVERRPMTPEETAAKEAYKKLLNHQAHFSEY